MIYIQTSDVNDAEPRLLVFNADPRLSFSEKTSPSRAETLAKRVETFTKHYRVEMVLFLNYILILIVIYFTFTSI